MQLYNANARYARPSRRWVRSPIRALFPLSPWTSNWAPDPDHLRREHANPWGDGQAASALPKKAVRCEGFQPTLLAQLFGETLDLRSEHLAARLREDVGEVAHDDKGNKPTPPRARQP